MTDLSAVTTVVAQAFTNIQDDPDPEWGMDVVGVTVVEPPNLGIVRVDTAEGETFMVVTLVQPLGAEA